ncbi:hypothetical protein CAEBREN_29956 [Caenorhabditis brenneri]|uniref:Uncharacterized protein n=1 Tax=Caenorhabditis brenneri TaxID=135651 RepID=G0NQ50_CAEBE|nr:hypothetical protein CAEBREN_29956 [Caenorhabditis brenneri]
MAKFKYRWNRILPLIFILLVFIFVFNAYWSPGPIKVRTIHSDKDRGKGDNGDGEMMDLLRDQKCKIPKLDINGPEVSSFFHDPVPLECQIPGRFEKEWLFLDDQGVIRFSEEHRKAICQMQYFWRIDDESNGYGEIIYVKDGDKFDGGEYASVSCYEGWSKWTTLLWNITPSLKAVERAKKLREEEKKKYNVYILGFDSLSQMSFRRKLPKTVKFLEETLGSVVLNGYNIVGDGTPQALIPILTAKTETELPLTRRRFSEAKYLDEVYPMIWNNYTNNGYVTMFGEDMHLYGTFSYRLKGFRQQPTDHYSRTFFRDVESRGDKNCINSQPIHKIWLKKSEQFMKVYKDLPRFSFMFQGLLSHDDINLVGVEDEDVAAHLKTMNSEGLFDDSIVIVMADHGHRFAKLRETHQGQLEERMPFFSISLPKQLKMTEKGKVMEKNLRENAEKLTSPFDIPASLIDILNLPDDSEEKDSNQMQDASHQRSLSVFRPIPEDRTCAQAGIEAHWCTC